MKYIAILCATVFVFYILHIVAVQIYARYCMTWFAITSGFCDFALHSIQTTAHMYRGTWIHIIGFCTTVLMLAFRRLQQYATQQPHLKYGNI